MTTNVFKEENLFLVVFGKLMTSLIISLFVTFVISLLFGYQYLLVRTGSMEPTLHQFTLVILAPEKFENLKELDIVTFKGVEDGTMTFTHRIRGFTETGELITAGDANIDSGTGEVSLDNSTTPKSRYIGKVVGNIYPIGLIIMFLKENTMMAGVILVVGLMLYILLCDEESDSVFE